MKKLNFEATGVYKRIDVFLAENTDLTRSHINKLIENGNVLLNGKVVKKSSSVKIGDVIEVTVDDPIELDLSPVNMPLDIVYQDSDIAVINKPQGLTVHAGGGTHGDTLVNYLLYHLDSLSGINGVVRPGIVHRIDKDTSGLLVVAKNDNAHLSLQKQIQNKTCKRNYIALLEGNLKNDSGHISTLIGRSEKDRKLMAVVTHGGRAATTDYKVLQRFNGYTLCEFMLGTGRTHQIRVHAKYLGYPIVGDKSYGIKKQKFDLEGQLLHAYKLTLTHPTTGEEMVFEAPLPDYFENILKILRK